MSTDDPQNKMILATGGYDHTIHFWLAHSGVRSFSVQHPSSQVNSMEITPNRQLLAAAGFQHIRMYDIHSNNANPVVNYEGVQKNFTAVGFQEEGRWMFTGSEDNSAKIWDLRSRTLQCQRMFGTNAPVNCVCLHPNQSELYIGDQSGIIYLWDLRSENNEQQMKRPFFKVTEPHISIQSIHIDAEGTSMAAVDNKAKNLLENGAKVGDVLDLKNVEETIGEQLIINGNFYFFTLSYGSDQSHSQPVRKIKFEAHNTYGLKCKFSPDSTLLVTTSADCSAKLWRTSDLQLLLEQPNSPVVEKGGESGDSNAPPIVPMIKLSTPNQRWVWDVAFSADSQYLFTASSDNLARLWNLSTGEVKREYSGHSKALTALAFKDGA